MEVTGGDFPFQGGTYWYGFAYGNVNVWGWVSGDCFNNEFDGS